MVLCPRCLSRTSPARPPSCHLPLHQYQSHRSQQQLMVQAQPVPRVAVLIVAVVLAVLLLGTVVAAVLVLELELELELVVALQVTVAVVGLVVTQLQQRTRAQLAAAAVASLPPIVVCRAPQCQPQFPVWMHVVAWRTQLQSHPTVSRPPLFFPFNAPQLYSLLGEGDREKLVDTEAPWDQEDEGLSDPLGEGEGLGDGEEDVDGAGDTVTLGLHCTRGAPGLALPAGHPAPRARCVA